MQGGGRHESDGGQLFRTKTPGCLLDEVDCTGPQDGVMLKVKEQARRIEALRLAGSSATEGHCSAEPGLASSSASRCPSGESG